MSLVGSYNIYVDGELVSSSKNVITTTGVQTIKRYLAGSILDWCGGMAVGAINTTAATSDLKLGFEIERQPTIFRSLDADGNIIVKAAFSTTLEAVIREVGIYPFPYTASDKVYQDDIITDFSAGSASGNSSVGSKNVALSTGTPAYTETGLSIDISGYAPTDRFQLLVYNSDANAKTVQLKISNGVTEYTVGNFSITAGVGFKSVELAIGNSTITSITQVTLTSTAANKALELDCLKFLNTDQTDYISGIVSRSIPATPITKLAGQELEVEYKLGVF